MRKLFVVTSTIQPREGKFSYSKTRSYFTAEERFRQTIFTVNSIQNLFPNDDIVIVDSSDEYNEYIETFTILGVKFIPLKEISSEAFEIVNSHLSKSLCECLMLNSFFKYYKNQLSEYDFIVKACGRYFYSNMNEQMFNEQNKYKMFFKHPMRFKWDNSWKYQFVDLRKTDGQNVLSQYCTVLYAFGISHLQKIIDINETAIHIIEQPEMYHYDIETLSYYLTRPYKNEIVEVDWRVSGWDGTSGKLMHY